MKVNKTIAYALSCLKELANQYGDFVQVGDIARKHTLPAAYCQKILLSLSRAGIVESVKGRGFTLAKPIGMITTLEVLKALSAPVAGDRSYEYAQRLITDVLAEKAAHPVVELRLPDTLAVNA